MESTEFARSLFQLTALEETYISLFLYVDATNVSNDLEVFPSSFFSCLFLSASFHPVPLHRQANVILYLHGNA